MRKELMPRPYVRSVRLMNGERKREAITIRNNIIKFSQERMSSLSLDLVQFFLLQRNRDHIKNYLPVSKCTL